MRANERIVSISRNFHSVESRLQIIIDALGLVRNLAAAVDTKEAEVTGAQIWGMIGLIQDEAQRALDEHQP